MIGVVSEFWEMNMSQLLRSSRARSRARRFFERSRPIFLYIEPCHVCSTVWKPRFTNRVRSHSLVTIHRAVSRTFHHSWVPMTSGVEPSGTSIE